MHNGHDTIQATTPLSFRQLPEQLDRLPACVYIKDPLGRYVAANQTMCDLLQQPLTAIIGRRDEDYFDLDRAPGVTEHDRQVLIDGLAWVGEEKCWHKQQQEFRSFLSLKLPWRDTLGQVVGLIGVSIDASNRAPHSAALEQNRLLDLFLNHIDAHIFQKDANGRFLYANRPVVRLYGRTEAEILGHTDLELLPEEIARALMATDQEILQSGQPRACQEAIRGADGVLRHFWSSKLPLLNPGQPPTLVGVATDISELLELQERLHRQQTTDELTGLANRSLFESRLQQALTAEDTTWAVILLDLDDFKYINSAHGQATGDTLLRQVALRLEQCPAAQQLRNTIARFGANRYALLLEIPNADSGAQVAQMASCLTQTLALPLQIGEQLFHLTASIGVSLYPLDSQAQQQLLSHAEAALYQAKALGRNQVCFYSPELGQRVQERAHLEHALRAAIVEPDQAFELHYQPKIQLLSGQAVGVEALLRWPRPEGMVSPLQFIPLAEQLGLINALGGWAITTACRQLAAWRGTSLDGLKIAVNLSAHQLRDDKLVSFIADQLQRYGVPAKSLELEVTESLMMDNPERAIAYLHQLRALGVSLAIDDFGTGFSSFSYLKQLPVDCLKLDKAFITNIAKDAREADLCAGLIMLAKRMGLTVVAEGVEEEAQLELLRQMDCELIQGYFYSKPLSIRPLEDYLRGRTALQNPQGAPKLN
ncbi:PAS/GGDEF domain protein [gamma proteobacterium HdN1]|nr:PAS/GGDEF domain protein [gamma proteobacterium HdN1]